MGLRDINDEVARVSGANDALENASFMAENKARRGAFYGMGDDLSWRK